MQTRSNVSSMHPLPWSGLQGIEKDANIQVTEEPMPGLGAPLAAVYMAALPSAQNNNVFLLKLWWWLRVYYNLKAQSSA